MDMSQTAHYVHDAETHAGDLHRVPLELVPRLGYDFVLFSQTLEHLYDPFLAVRNLFDLMVPGGYIFTSTPAENIPHMVPSHFFHY